MKNIKLKTGFAIIFSFAICSLKAQSSLQQKFQKDMEQRKKHVNEVLLKAREQQIQRQAERTNEVNFTQQNAANSAQLNTQPVPVQQNKNAIKPQPVPVIKKPVTTQQKGSARKEIINQ